MRNFWLFFFIAPLALYSENDEEALFLRRIADFWQEGEYQIAKEQMEEFIVEYPKSPFSDALNAALGDLFLREKNFSSALKYYSQIQSEEFVEKVFLSRMQCLYEMQWYATLIDECEAYLQIKDVLQVRYFLGIALYQQCVNSSQEPDSFLEIALRTKPHFETLYASEFSDEIALAYAHLCCILKEEKRAIEIYSDLAKKEPSLEEEMLFQIALIQSEYEREKSLETFDKICQLRGKKAKEAAYNWMVVAFDLGLYEELLERDLFQSVPDEKKGTARLFLGRALLHLKRYEDAIGALKIYIQEAPLSETLFAAILSLLDASYQASDLASLDEAIDRLESNYPRNEEIPKAYFSRAQILKRQDRLEEAKEELEKLLSGFPAFAQRAQVLFELSHLAYKSKNWSECYAKGGLFLKDFPEHELASFVWRYFVSSSAEIATTQKSHQKTLLSDLEKFLKFPLSEEEKSEWELLLAKTHYESGDYEKAKRILHKMDTPNAILLLSLCHRDKEKDLETFCALSEEALSKGANLVNPAQIHASLYNSYLELKDFEKAAQHLYEAFMAKADLKVENLLWLSQYFYEQLQGGEKNFILAARTASLMEKCKEKISQEQGCKSALHLDTLLCRLAKTYSILGKMDDAIALLEPIETKSHEMQLLLAESYAKRGEQAKALEMFDAIAAFFGTARSKVSASALLQASKIRMGMEKTEGAEIAKSLKNLILQKSLESEPLHLEAALEYVDFLSKKDPLKRKSLLEKTKLDFEKEDDLLSKDYHLAREKSPEKDLLYRGYMDLIQAQILLEEAKLDRDQQKELKAKAKNLLLQIRENQTEICLQERVRKILADEKE